jgi:SAM-dependent methyltransferase
MINASLSELAQALAARQISSVELTRLFLERAQRLNPELNAFVTLHPEVTLAQARARGVAVGLHQVGLQELAFEDEFDAAMTVDAMENVFPEDWPAVLANLRRAVHPGGHLYLTVEEVPETDLDEAFADLSARGLPAVRGEVIEGDVAGYHFYPGRGQVAAWLKAAGLEIVEQEAEALGDWGYWHILLRVG